MRQRTGPAYAVTTLLLSLKSFAELRHASQTHNVTLRQLADALVETASGRTPDGAELRKVIWHEWERLFPHSL